MGDRVDARLFNTSVMLEFLDRQKLSDRPQISIEKFRFEKVELFYGGKFGKPVKLRGVEKLAQDWTARYDIADLVCIGAIDLWWVDSDT